MNNIFLFTSASLAMTLCVYVYSSVNHLSPSFSSRLHLRKFFAKRESWLREARVHLSAGQFWLATLCCGLFTFSIVALISKTPLVSLVIAIGFSGIPYAFISKKRAAISRELINAWPDALRDISSTISAGHSLSFALRTLGTIGPAPIAPHMARFAVLEQSMGFVAGLEIIREEMSDSTTDRILEVLIVANERGGKVVKEIIDDLIETTTEDIALADTIATESIEMKINSRAVVIIPWVVLFLLTLSGGIFRDFYSSAQGALIIGIGAVLSAIGILVLSYLSRIEIEPRVFMAESRAE